MLFSDMFVVHRQHASLVSPLCKNHISITRSFKGCPNSRFRRHFTDRHPNSNDLFEHEWIKTGLTLPLYDFYSQRIYEHYENGYFWRILDYEVLSQWLVWPSDSRVLDYSLTSLIKILFNVLKCPNHYMICSYKCMWVLNFWSGPWD